MLGIKIFFWVQTFRRRPFVPSRKFCLPETAYSKTELMNSPIQLCTPKRNHLTTRYITLWSNRKGLTHLPRFQRPNSNRKRARGAYWSYGTANCKMCKRYKKCRLCNICKICKTCKTCKTCNTCKLCKLCKTCKTKGRKRARGAWVELWHCRCSWPVPTALFDFSCFSCQPVPLPRASTDVTALKIRQM